MVYGALLAAARAHDPGALGRYEPFLWGQPTWDKLPGDIGDAFSHTDSINARGLYAHTQSPLFQQGPHSVLDGFIDDTLPRDHSVVAKIIRGAGRLSAFLERDPNLKIVHLIRNPLDVVNSALLYFSFFGGEFHPSDEGRFNQEAAQRFAGQHSPTLDLTEAGRSLEWWRLMNEAALQSEAHFPDRLKIVPYESLMADLPGMMADIVEFMGGDAHTIDEGRLSDNVGPVTSWKSLRAVDRDAILPHVDAYFNDQRIFRPGQSSVDTAAVKAGLLEKYSGCGGGPPFELQIEPSLAPTRVRAMAIKAQQAADASRTAGEAQVKAITANVSAAVSALEGTLEAKMSASISVLEGNISALEGNIGALKSNVAGSIQQVSDTLAEDAARESAELSEAVALITAQIADAAKAIEARDAGAAALASELGDKKAEISTIKLELSAREARIGDLEGQLEAAKASLAELKLDSEKDLQASQQLIARLRDRVAALQDEQVSQLGVSEKMRLEKRDLADKLKKTENRLRTVAGEREQFRQQLVELAGFLAPRLSTVVTLRPLRYVFRQRQQVKAGLIEIDANGVARPKQK